MSDKKIIALTGLKGSGKDTAYNAIRGTYKQFRFATALKKMIIEMLVQAGYQRHEARLRVENSKLKEEPMDLLDGKTPREIMQSLGTEWGRDMVAQDIWVNITMRAVNKAYRQTCCITDLRFPNELKAVRAAGGKVIRIVRPGIDLGVGSAHPSEAFISQMEPDAEIINDRSKAHLYRQMVATINTLDGVTS